MNSPRWQDSGKDPDYRFSFANERTFLAWIRTALAILAGALLLHQLAGTGHALRLQALAAAPPAAFSGLLAAGSYSHWKAHEIAMRHGLSLPSFLLIPAVAAVVALIGIGSAVLLVLN